MTKKDRDVRAARALSGVNLREGVWDWCRIEPTNSADGADSAADVYIYEQIGYDWWSGDGITAKGFAKQINALDVDVIRLHINSPGGLAFDGITIMNALRDHKARVEVTIDGLAASAASVIAMAGDTVTMNRGTQLMIHDASTIAWGNAEEISRTLNVLNTLSDSIAETYMAKAGESRTHWRDLMKAETWYTAEEAVAAGLADTWVDATETTPEDPVDQFDLSILAFAYAGRENAPAPPVSVHKTPSSTEPGTTTQDKELNMSDKFLAGVRERLGVTEADASEETVLAALDQALEEQADNPANTVPEGVVMMDQAQLDQLRNDAKAGREARAQQETDRRDRIVDAAMDDGRIAASSREHYRALLDTDEERTTKLLSSLAKNTVPVTELGHQPAEASADDALYESIYGSQKKEGVA